MPPRQDSDESKEGTEAHERLERSLVGDATWRVGADPEMVAAIDVVHGWLDGLAVKHGTHLVIQIEQPFVFPQDVVPPDDAAGVADIMVLDPITSEAWSVDFKYGQGVVVEPQWNPQLLFNAVGRLWQTPVARVNLVVIQPRIEHHPRGVIRTWTCGPVELAEFQIEVEHAIRAAETVFAVQDIGESGVRTEDLRAGSWCRWCPAEVACPGRQAQALALAFGDSPPAPRDLPGQQPPDPTTLGLDRLAYILHHKDMLTTWLRSIENHARELAKKGIAIPGFKLVEAQARRQWNGQPAAIADELMAAVGYTLTLDDVMPRELLDITKAEALLAQKARELAGTSNAKKQHAARDAKDRMAFLTLKQSSGNLVLVPESDSRPAADRASVAFSGVSIPPV